VVIAFRARAWYDGAMARARDGETDTEPRICLVTGANRGIGREVCRQLARRGHTVVLTARGAGAAEAAVRGLGADGADGARVHALRLDVSSAADVARAAAEFGSRFDRLDVLVNNAAIGYDPGRRASSADLGAVRATMDTNFYGAWQTTLAFLPLLRRSGHPRVVNVSSEAGSMAAISGGSPGYTASKVALNALTLMLAGELRGEGFLVNSVCPGWVATDMGGGGGRPVADGAAGVVWAALLPDGGPNGGFFRDGRPLAW
jgi:NAD(P)-dependent dehydrogenase (short-subunit alcohol dehydrogenase family)